MSETPEQTVRRRITVLIETVVQDTTSGIPVTDFTPYLLVKVLEQLEFMNAKLTSIESSLTDFWNSRYNT